MMKDPFLLENLNSQIGENTVFGPVEAQKRIEDLIALPMETRVWLKQWIYNKYEIRI